MLTFILLISFITTLYLTRSAYKKMERYGCVFIVPVLFLGTMAILNFVTLLTHWGG